MNCYFDISSNPDHQIDYIEHVSTLNMYLCEYQWILDCYKIRILVAYLPHQGLGLVKLLLEQLQNLL